MTRKLTPISRRVLSPSITTLIFVCAFLFSSGCRSVSNADRSGSPASAVSVVAANAPRADYPEAIDRIAFGSCARETDPQPIWTTILGARPDVFLFTGDNIYGDTDDMQVMRAKYDMLGAKPGYGALVNAIPVMATWDDHDYGRNDAGEEYEYRAESQAEFLRFFGVPEDSDRWKQRGIYDAKTFGPVGKRTQIIMLDTRYFRSSLERWPKGESPFIGPYKPTADVSKTVLGEEQWAWLKEQLSQPADLRIVVSSIQAIPGEHGFETWANFPHERRRLFKLIESVDANGVVLVSGDRHLSEMSVMPPDDVDGADYPIYEVTSSALVRPSRSKSLEPNRYRVHTDNYRLINFGIIETDWDAPRPVVKLQIRDADGIVALEHVLYLDELR